MSDENLVAGCDEHARRLMDALGIDWKSIPVKQLTFNMEAGKLVEVTIVRYVRTIVLDEFVEVASQYKLVPKDA